MIQNMSLQLATTLSCRAALNNGTIVWQKHSYVANLNTRTPAHNVEKYMENSGLLLKEAFAMVAGRLSRR